MSRALSGEVPRFDVVAAITPVRTTPCAHCGARIVDTYYECDQSVICDTCHARAAAELAAPDTGRLGRAVLLGLAAAAIGAGAYFAMLSVTGRDLAVVLVAVGFLIGKAVRVGSGGRGGRRYQWLAAGLTYAAIASTYVPFVTSAVGGRVTPTEAAAATPALTPAPSGYVPVDGSPELAAPIPSASVGPAHLGALLLLATAAPVLAGFSNLAGIAITIAALLIAWRLNRRVERSLSGPYRVGAH